MPYTNDDTVRTLCKSVVNRLENQHYIEFEASKRKDVIDELFQMTKPSIITEEDLRQRTLKKLGAQVEELEQMDLAESTQFRTARAMIRKEIGENELNGLFFQKTLKEIAQSISEYFMKSSLIEEVYETDLNMERLIVEIFHKFNPTNMS